MTQPIPAGEFLHNASFEDDKPTDISVQGHSWVIPNWWNVGMTSVDEWPRVEFQDQNFADPEIRVITFGEQFPETFLLAGPGKRILKIFKDSAPTFASINQQIDIPSGFYKFTVPVFPDLLTYDNKRPNTSANWYLGATFRLFAQSDNVVKDVEFDLRQAPIGEYTRLALSFKHQGGLVRVGFEFLGRWGFKNNCCFIDDLHLEMLEDPSANDEEVRRLRIENEQLKSDKAQLLNVFSNVRDILTAVLESN